MKKLLVIFLVGMFSIQISAQSVTPQINQTQKKQHARIKEGIKSGELTKHEAKQLRRQQVHIQRDKKIAKADGFVTNKERNHLRNEQDRASKNIFRKKHNKRTT